MAAQRKSEEGSEAHNAPMHESQSISELVADWRAKATVLRTYGADRQAQAVERCLTDLEEALDQVSSEALTLQEAADATGYTADHIGRLVREGKIHNVGRKGAPRVRRSDLPIKPKRRIAPVAERSQTGQHSNRQVVRSIIEGAG